MKEKTLGALPPNPHSLFEKSEPKTLTFTIFKVIL